MSVATDSWRRIRSFRAQHPALLDAIDADGSRTRVFQAALTQAEELWEAASVAGVASRPLPLFYCLSQTGRAICAAWTTPGPWEPAGHGLSSRQEPVPENPLEFTVRTTAHGAFQMVAEVLSSTIFQGRASLGALWASLPDLPEPPDARYPRPVFLESTLIRGEEATIVNMLAQRQAKFSFPYPAALRDTLLIEDEQARAAAIQRALAEYPAAESAVVEIAEILGPGGYQRSPIIRFLDANGQNQSVSAVAEALPTLSSATREGWRNYVLRPCIDNGGTIPPSQLMTLWALIYGLSQLARYHPAQWVSALDFNESKIAVDLERLLDSCLALVPDLLVPAISNGAMPRLVREYDTAERERQRAQEEANAQPANGV
jgi:hypothetical protein